MDKNFTDEQLINNKGKRDELVSRVDVLDKVKDLLLLPQMEMATTKQVAEFYEVDFKAINSIINRNRDELESDGMMKYTRTIIKENLKLQNEATEITPYVAILEDENGNEYKFTNRGSMMFPKRAILRIGMLLRDSKVAKEVRTQLLNIII